MFYFRSVIKVFLKKKKTEQNKTLNEEDDSYEVVSCAPLLVRLATFKHREKWREDHLWAGERAQ